MPHLVIPASLERRQAAARIALAGRHNPDQPQLAEDARLVLEREYLRDTITALGGRLAPEDRDELVAMLAAAATPDRKRRNGSRR